MSWSNLKYLYNFTNLGFGNAISQNANGKYEIQYLLPETSDDLKAIDYKSISDYYNGVVPDDRVTSFSKLNEDQAGAVRMILGNESDINLYAALYEDVSNVILWESLTTSAAIVWGQNPETSDLFDGAPDGVIALTTVVNPEDMPTTSGDDAWGRHGDIWLNANFSSWEDVQIKGTIGYWAIMHEPGHSLGLKDAEDVFSGTSEDSQQYTIMSYNAAGWVGGTATQNALYYDDKTSPLYAYGLQLYDIAAIQDIYGVNDARRPEDTTYAFGAGLGRGGSKDNAFLYTIWDGGGDGDTIDASAFTGYNAKISLVAGSFSSIGGNGLGGQGYDPTNVVSGVARDINNVAIAYNTLIENAIGADGNDLIIGNGEANQLTGGKGNDELTGWLGSDIYKFGASDGDDTIIDAGNQNAIVYENTSLSAIILSIDATNNHDLRFTTIGGNVLTVKDQYTTASNLAVLNFRLEDSSNIKQINLAAIYASDLYDGSGPISINASTIYTAFDACTVADGDVVIGSDGANYLFGLNDQSDYLAGGRGVDVMRGGTGAQDTYFWQLGDSSDRIIDDWADGDTLDLGAGISSGWVTTSTSGSDLLLNIADISGYGATLRIIGQAANAASFITSHVTGLVEEAAPTTSGAALWGTEVWHPELTPPAYVREDLNDTVTGTGGNESLEGRTGDDYLSGGAGNDKLDGGEGADTVHGDSGDDKLREIYSTGDKLYGDAGNDLLYAAYAAILDGGDGDDVIYAGTGSTVTGGAGDDIVYAYASAVNGGTGENVIRLAA